MTCTYEFTYILSKLFPVLTYVSISLRTFTFSSYSPVSFARKKVGNRVYLLSSHSLFPLAFFFSRHLSPSKYPVHVNFSSHSFSCSPTFYTSILIVCLSSWCNVLVSTHITVSKTRSTLTETTTIIMFLRVYVSVSWFFVCATAACSFLLISHLNQSTRSSL